MPGSARCFSLQTAAVFPLHRNRSRNAVSILYADELFRWDLSFQIQNAETAEPSEWEMMKRYLSWTVLTIMLLVLYIVGLRA